MLASALAGLVGPHVAGYTAPAPPAVLRLHVVANSDDPRDQALKLQVRDALVPLLADAVAGAPDLAAARARVEARRPQLMARARAAIEAAGHHDPVRVEVGQFSFPARRWGDRVYPAGTYDAVRIVIGEGRGHNFWCVLFPGLCGLGEPSHSDGGRAVLAAAPQALAGQGAPAPAAAPGPAADGAAAGADWAAAPPAYPAGVQTRWFFLDWWHAGWARWKTALGLAPSSPEAP